MLGKCPVFKEEMFDSSRHSSKSEVLKVFSKVGCEILSRDIEACHRLINNDRIIENFCEEKTAIRSCQLKAPTKSKIGRYWVKRK